MTTDNRDEIAALEARLAELRANEAGATTPEPQPVVTAQTPKKDGMSWIGWTFLIGGGVLVAALIIGSVQADKDTNDLKASIERTDALLEELNGPDVGDLKERWTYTVQTDPMTDKRTDQACIHSKENVRQEWPYETVPAVLCVRQSPRHGLDAYVYLEGEGQLLSRREGMKVRFDDGAQQHFGGADAADSSTNIAFFTNPSRLLNGVKSADLTRVELVVYNAGVQVVEFNTKGLEWPRPSAAG